MKDTTKNIIKAVAVVLALVLIVSSIFIVRSCSAPPDYEEIRERVEEAVRGLYGSVALAADYGITLSDGDVKGAAAEYVNAVKEYYKTEGEYKKELENPCLWNPLSAGMVRKIPLR